MKHKYKIATMGIILAITIYGFTALIPIKKTVVKLLDKNSTTCGYYKQQSKTTYYLYDGKTVYNTDANSCRKLKSKSTIDNIIIIDDSKKMDTAIVNSIGDDNWYGEVKETFKQIDKINY